MEWMPIETAPRDGRRILIFSDGAMHVAGYKSHRILFEILSDDAGSMICNPPPSHWMPLPSPPTDRRTPEVE